MSQNLVLLFMKVLKITNQSAKSCAQVYPHLKKSINIYNAYEFPYSKSLAKHCARARDFVFRCFVLYSPPRAS